MHIKPTTDPSLSIYQLVLSFVGTYKTICKYLLLIV